MKSWYPVYWNRERAGEVTVTKQGLYFVFSCRVQVPSEARCRLYAHTEGNSRDLGLCVPDGDWFVLQTKVPVKYFGTGEYRFCLNQPTAEVFVPASNNCPFSAVDRLESGKFAIREGEPGIVFPVTKKPSHKP